MMGIVVMIVETQNIASLRSPVPLHFPVHYWFWQFQLFREYDLT